MDGLGEEIGDSLAGALAETGIERAVDDIEAEREGEALVFGVPPLSDVADLFEAEFFECELGFVDEEAGVMLFACDAGRDIREEHLLVFEAGIDQVEGQEGAGVDAWDGDGVVWC